MSHVKNSRDLRRSPRPPEGNRRVFGLRGGPIREVPGFPLPLRALLVLGAFWGLVALAWWLGGVEALLGITLGFTLVASVAATLAGLLAERGERDGLVHRGQGAASPPPAIVWDDEGRRDPHATHVTR